VGLSFPLKWGAFTGLVFGNPVDCSSLPRPHFDMSKHYSIGIAQRLSLDYALSLDWIYSQDTLRCFSIDTEQGKSRLRALTQSLPALLDTAHLKLPSNPRVCCLMAGSCIEGIAFCEVYDAKVTCLDTQEKLLARGLKEARKRKLDLVTVVGDARDLESHITGPFDLITVVGSSLPHLSIMEFDRVLAKSKGILSSRGTILVEQSDIIFRILLQYRDVFVTNLKPPVINLHIAFNPRNGYFERLSFTKTRQDNYKTFLWGPWIVEYIMKKTGFSKVEVAPFVDPFFAHQTFLITGRS